MATFPVIVRKGAMSGYSETHSSDAIKVASKASGLPLLNKLFTFDPRTWKYTVTTVTNADKLTLLTFYDANKDVPFDWLNPQDGNTYEVIFDKPPVCTMAGSDGTNIYWKINLVILQYSPL